MDLNKNYLQHFYRYVIEEVIVQIVNTVRIVI
jgi:hypothetical protein